MTNSEGVNGPQDPHDSSADSDQSQMRTSRRRFGKAGLAAPVLMTLASRPVWATGKQCSISALASLEGGSSIPVDLTTCQACSPGYWHQNVCWPNGWTASTLFWEQFGYDRASYEALSASTVDSGYPTYVEIVEVLDMPLLSFFPSGVGGGDSNGKKALVKACRAATAAMLNAVHPHVPFALFAADILQQLHTAFPLAANKISDPPPVGDPRPTGDLVGLTANLSLWDEDSDECILPGSGADTSACSG